MPLQLIRKVAVAMTRGPLRQYHLRRAEWLAFINFLWLKNSSANIGPAPLWCNVEQTSELAQCQLHVSVATRNIYVGKLQIWLSKQLYIKTSFQFLVP